MLSYGGAGSNRMHTQTAGDGSTCKLYLRRRFKAKKPTSRSITTTTGISAPVDSCHMTCRIFEDMLDDGGFEGLLNVSMLVVVGDTLVLVKVFVGMTVE